MDLNKYSINKIRTELWTACILSEQRCLRKACEFVEDLLFSLPEDGEEKLLTKLEKDLNDINSNFCPELEYAKSCFELHEYDRAAHISRNHQDDDQTRFLHYFSRYKAAEKKRIDLMSDVSLNLPKKALIKFNELRDSLERSIDRVPPDGWLLYVYALVLFKLKLQKWAVTVLVDSINASPQNWSAWHLLSTLIDKDDQLNALSLPNHIFKVFFYTQMRQKLDMGIDEPWTMLSKKDTLNILDKHFKDSHFMKTQNARSYGYSTGKYKAAMELFNVIRKDDPYRVDSMDLYSNLLYVRKYVEGLSKLAYEVEQIDPFTTEANLSIANSFSAREQHGKAVIYFNRALRLNPDHLDSWTLIGHEYLEMKNYEKALQAYRFAISINKRDCRAWLGLGNTSETKANAPNSNIRNLQECIYYYSQVGKYRPNDSIMYMALGTVFEKMGSIKEAMICKKRGGPDVDRFNASRLNDSDSMRI